MRKRQLTIPSGHRILRLMGLVETMCFTHTDDYGHWYVEDGQICFKYKAGKQNKTKQVWLYNVGLLETLCFERAIKRIIYYKGAGFTTKNDIIHGRTYNE